MVDYTALLRKLTPDRDGEPHTHLRVGTVSAVNSDGTLNVTMSGGVTVPNVPKLAGVYAPSGSVVQMISFRGSLLVLGATGTVPKAMLVRNATESVGYANGVWAPVTLNTAIIDTHSGLSSGGYAAPISGIYEASISGTWAFNAIGRRGVRFSVNGVAPTNYPAIIVPTQTGAGEIAVKGPSVLLDLTAGQIVRIEQFQNSGGALNNGAANGYYPSMRITYSG